MAISFSDLVITCAANRPDDEASLVGGAADAAARPIDNQPSAAGDIALISDGADTRSVTIEYRDAVGDVQTAAPTLTGTTEVTAGISTAEVLRYTLSAADANRSVIVRAGAGGNTLHVLGPNETEAVRQFRKTFATGSAKDYWEKYFLKNNGPDVRLVVYVEQADPDGLITFALEGVADGSDTAANRRTDPGHSFGAGPTIGVDLAAGAAQGIWFKQSLAAGQAVASGTWTTRITLQAA